MVGEGAEGVAVLLVAEHVGEVLLDAAVVGDVQYLHPTADAEYGHLARKGTAHERELVGVALLLDGSGLRVGLLVVEGGVQIPCSAGDDQGGEEVEYPVR